MNREIIDVPLIFSRMLSVNWRPDWRGQPPAEGTDSSEQVVFNRMPRFVGTPSLIFPPEMIGAWRALVLQAEGRVNAYRIRMVDPAVYDPARMESWHRDWDHYQRGIWEESRPRVETSSGAAAGATSLVVDETWLPQPIPVGCYLSHNDWPFAVVSRSGEGASVALRVKMLRRAIPAGAKIDLQARGLFLATSDAMGFPEYGLDRVASPQLDLIEWINR